MSESSVRRGARAALLLTDVVDSTQLAESLGDAAMAELWARHDRVARDLLPVHDGREIDKTDGFLMLFEQAADAVAYAVAYHRALRALGIAARAGLHVGDVILTENAPDDVARGAKPLEVDGIAKPTAARVMSLARGGQTLLTAAALEALGDTERRVVSHGHWRMKGVTEPVQLFEVGDDAAPFQPPPDGPTVHRRDGDLHGHRRPHGDRRAGVAGRGDLMVQLSSFLCGALFGLGLAVSGMTQPGKVLAFLDVGGAWDPSLAFVMGGALAVFGPTWFFVGRRRERPVLAVTFDLPKARQVTPQLIGGAAIFGVGWGLGGFCPGTAITSLPTLGAQVLAMVAGVLVGILVTWGAQRALAEDGTEVRPQADF